MLADELDYVVGIDTHLDEHVLAIVAAPSGAVIARRSVARKRGRLSGGAQLRRPVRDWAASVGSRGRAAHDLHDAFTLAMLDRNVFAWEQTRKLSEQLARNYDCALSRYLSLERRSQRDLHVRRRELELAGFRA
jgi:hypothetical protein